MAGTVVVVAWCILLKLRRWVGDSVDHQPITALTAKVLLMLVRPNEIGRRGGVWVARKRTRIWGKRGVEKNKRQCQEISRLCREGSTGRDDDGAETESPLCLQTESDELKLWIVPNAPLWVLFGVTTVARSIYGSWELIHPLPTYNQT